MRPKILTPQYCLREEFIKVNCDPAKIHTPKFYYKYTNSDIWWVVRRLALEHYGWKCMQCCTRKNLEVHHGVYSRKFEEKLSDLIILCSACHVRQHGYDNGQTDWTKIAA